MKKNNKGVIIAAVSAIGVASIATVTGIISRNLRKNLIKNLNDSHFEDLNGYGVYNNYKDDSYDDVLRHRKSRYYQRVKMY